MHGWPGWRDGSICRYLRSLRPVSPEAGKHPVDC